MPKAKKNQVNASNSCAKPYAMDNNCAVNSRRDQRASLESVGSLFDKEDIPSDPMTNKNVLKVFMRHHKLTQEAMKKQHNEIIENVQKVNMAIAEKNQEITNLKRLVQKLERKEKELKELSSGQANEINLLEQKYASINSKYISLEVGYDHEITKYHITIEKQKAELRAEQKRCDALTQELDAAKQANQYLSAKFESMMQQKDYDIGQLDMTCTQLQTQIDQIETEYEQNKLQLNQKWTAELQLTKKAQAVLQGELEQKSAALANEVGRRTQIETELVLTLTKLEDCEKNCVDLQQINKKLSEEAANTTKTFESEIEKQKLKIDELSSENKTVANAFKTEQQRYQNEIIALKEANAQLETMKSVKESEVNAELDLRQINIAELTLQIEELKNQNVNSQKHSSAEIAKLAEKLQDLQEVHKTSLASAQDKIMEKDVEIAACREAFAELERERNATVSELKYKINQIGHVFGQPVGTVGPQSKTQTNASAELSGDPEPSNFARVSVVEESSSDVTWQIQSELKSLSADGRNRRKSYKRPVYSMYNSDFTDISDNDQESNWEPPTKLASKNKYPRGNTNVKRLQLPILQETSDLFDKVKKS